MLSWADGGRTRPRPRPLAERERLRLGLRGDPAGGRAGPVAAGRLERAPLHAGRRAPGSVRPGARAPGALRRGAAPAWRPGGRRVPPGDLSRARAAQRRPPRARHGELLHLRRRPGLPARSDRRHLHAACSRGRLVLRDGAPLRGGRQLGPVPAPRGEHGRLLERRDGRGGPGPAGRGRGARGPLPPVGRAVRGGAASPVAGASP